MPPVQTDYGDNLAAAVAGMIADETPATYASRTIESAAGVGFGLAVSQGSEDKGAILFTDNVVGITVRERSLPAEQDSFAQYDSARLMTKGCIWVTANGAVAAGDAVHALAGGTLGNAAGTAIAGARWETSAADGELAIVRLG